IKCKIANMSCLFLVTDREFNHPIHQTTQNMSEHQYENKLFSVDREFWQILLGRYPHKQLCCSSHKCMFLTNVAPFKREINKLSNRIRFIAKKHCYNKEINYQTQMSLLFVLCLVLQKHQAIDSQETSPVHWLWV